MGHGPEVPGLAPLRAAFDALHTHVHATLGDLVCNIQDLALPPALPPGSG